ncbi:hypothetical protein GXM_01533 [Nostoc sphaeroides CCNUC1]|uniref:Uncharacterized protein n=1 Tax=Nostoc sphaeroides CCNUC1 TaxID=2653204 RepID=A0A5P8VUK6_9NOSO|nr:hypothetical protein GXM_01533 [Nostoc sphaeroides CCNUC1]
MKSIGWLEIAITQTIAPSTGFLIAKKSNKLHFSNNLLVEI